MPQRPYVPLGTLRRAVTYPLSPEAVDDEVVRQSIEDVGLAHFLDQLDADEPWDQVLSGGEKQRLGFARMLIQNPTMIVMDEATAALDPASQDRLMRLVLERLPEATLVSVAHRVELEAFHTRKLVLEYRDEGARLVGDEALQPAITAGVSRSRNHVRPSASASTRSRVRERRLHAVESACSGGRLPRTTPRRPSSLRVRSGVRASYRLRRRTGPEISGRGSG